MFAIWAVISSNDQEVSMRFGTKVMAGLVMMPVLLTQTPARALPYDPYPWCAEYSERR